MSIKGEKIFVVTVRINNQNETVGRVFIDKEEAIEAMWEEFVLRDLGGRGGFIRKGDDMYTELIKRLKQKTKMVVKGNKITIVEEKNVPSGMRVSKAHVMLGEVRCVEVE